MNCTIPILDPFLTSQVFMNDKTSSQKQCPSKNHRPRGSYQKMGLFLRRNFLNLVPWAVVALVFLHPDGKTFALQQLMRTGLFNPLIPDSPPPSDASATPDFFIQNHEGQKVHLSSLIGQVVFINFWASWCPPCRAEFPSIEALYERLKDHPQIVFMGVNMDDEAAQGQAFLDNQGYTLPLYRPGSAIPAEVYSGVLPTTVIIDKKGHIRWQKEGFADYSGEKFIQQLTDLIDE